MTLFDIFPAWLVQYVFLALPFVVAFVLPLAGIGAAFAIQRAHAFVTAEYRLSALLVLLIVGTTLSVALSGRTLLTAEDLVLNPFLLATITPLPYGRLASQICSVLVLLLAVSEILGWLLRRREQLGSGIAIVIGSLFLYFVLSLVISGLFGVFRNPRLNDLYFPLVAAALATLGAGVNHRSWSLVRFALFAVSLAGLITAVVLPDLAVARNFRQTVIPGISFRLYGLADHANALGFVAAIGLLLEFSTRVRPRPAVAFVCIHLAVLILSQSKTAWLAILPGLAVVRYGWLRDELLHGDRWKTAVVTMLLGIAAAIALVTSIYAIASSERLVAYFGEIGIFTFTGRTNIWLVSWEEFLKSPMTGYGPSIWDPEFRIERGIFFAGQAHNQFMHVIGQAGLLGLVGMLIHLGVLFYFALTRYRVDQGLALALLTMLLIRCWSESPLRMGAIMGWDAFIHIVCLVAVIGLAHRPAPRQQIQEVRLARHDLEMRGI